MAKLFHDAAFPYIGKPALGLFAYLGVLVQHKFFTSSVSNHTPFWKSIARLMIALGVVWIFTKQLEFVTWDQNVVALYFNKTFVPCGGAAFVLCSMTDSIFELLGLLNKEDSAKRYCVYINDNELEGNDSDSSDSSRRESLLRMGKKGLNV